MTSRELVRLGVEADLRELLEMPHCQDVIRQLAQANGVLPVGLAGPHARQGRTGDA